MPSLPWLSAVTVLVTAVVAFLLLAPKVRKAEGWRATVTPLASIIGSGFLVVGPILLREYGHWAPVMMMILCATAYAFGASVRSNIRHYEPLAEKGDVPAWTGRFERVSSWLLAAAYVVSVTYYLNLLGEFALSLTSLDDRFSARLVTSAVLLFIGVYGLIHGLAKLESVEQLAVTVKLAIIGGLLVALGYHAVALFEEKGGIHNLAGPLDLHSLFLAFGLVITVQGFETSRYLGEEHDADTRVRTMRIAQGVSAAIYLVYVASLTWAFRAGEMGTSETAIIGVTEQVAPVLPAMLVAAALAAQFSAAVADTAGCGGLVHELSHGKWSAGKGYVAVMVAGLALTWTADVFDIIEYGSRAFAAYYACQAMVAASLARRRGAWPAVVGHGALALLGAAIAILGASVEGGG